MTIIVPFIVVVLAPFLVGFTLYGLRLRVSTSGWVAGGSMSVLFVIALLQLSGITAAGSLTYVVPWVPEIGLNFSLYLDGLALLFVLLITGIGAAVMIYAGYYFDEDAEAGRFFALLLAFSGSMLGLILAGNVLTLFIAWELTSITSFLLISFKGSDSAARRGASQALIITAGGGLALLVGLLVMGSVTGSLEMADILSNGDLLRAHPFYNGILILVAIGAFSKSAQFPVHFWLPGAMSAPTPASAFLHSATMVKAGIYLLARFHPVLGDTPLWTNLLTTVGLITLFLGAALAMRKRDLKAILAYSTISQLGAFVALIGLPGHHGLEAAYVGIFAHGLYKCALFLVAGAIDHATGTRDTTVLGRLRHKLPGFAAVTGIAVLSMAGVPPLLGFVSKELLLESFIDNPIPLVVIVASAALTVGIAFRLFWDLFVAPPQSRTHVNPEGVEHSHEEVHALPRWMVAGPAALAILSLVAGIGISPLIEPLIEPALGEDISLYLFPPYGIGLPFVLSMTALGIGMVIFLTRRMWLAWSLPTILTGTQVYHSIVRAVGAIGDNLLKLQHGKIRLYLGVILAVVVVLLGIAIASSRSIAFPPIEFHNASDVLKAALLILSLIATGASLLTNKHLVAVLCLGVAGYAIGGIFLLEPAPDVALVQFLVETLATVLIILMLVRINTEERARVMEKLWTQPRPGLIRDVVLSTVVGAAMTIFALAAVNSRPTPTIAEWHLENAYEELGVTDVVAAIVTDFRGTDTLIEITVFSMAGLGVLTLLTRPEPGTTTRIIARWRKRNTEEFTVDAVESGHDESVEELPILYLSRFVDPITKLAAFLALPFAFVIAVAHILYGGVAPGDGFTAGVICGLAVALWYVVFGFQETKQRLPWVHPARFVGLGLVIAYGNAALPLIFGSEFLSFSRLDAISIADIKIASTTIFELGICLAVFGGVSMIMEAISHPRESETL